MSAAVRARTANGGVAGERRFGIGAQPAQAPVAPGPAPVGSVVPSSGGANVGTARVLAGLDAIATEVAGVRRGIYCSNGLLAQLLAAIQAQSGPGAEEEEEEEEGEEAE